MNDAPVVLRGARRGLAWIIASALRGLHLTVRTRWLGSARIADLHARRAAVGIAVWHGRAVLLAPSRGGYGAVFGGRPRAVLVSASGDGAWASAILGDLGYEVVRGSSSRSAVSGLRALRRALTAGRSPILTVDGPRGPAGTVAPGIVAVAPRDGLWIVPLASAPRRGIRLGSWDRQWIPAPFTTVVSLVGRPIHLDPRTEDREACRARLQERLRSLHRTAERLARGPSPEVRAALAEAPA
ncbi:MAG: DUF374 domain-containing protein [Proteobacteria bacterium]|nr:DUF374 domain-containing protein [Pseudomonadota bacterium]